MEIIESGRLVLNYDMANGSFSVAEKSSGNFVFSGAFAGARISSTGKWLNTTSANSRLVSRIAESLIINHSFNDVPYSMELRIRPIENTDGFTLDLAFENNSPADVQGVDFYPLIIDRTKNGLLFGSGQGDFRFLRNGLLTWSLAGVYRGDEKMPSPHFKWVYDACENPEVGPPHGKGHFIGEWFGAVKEASTGGLLIAGFLSSSEMLGQISFKSREGYFRSFAAVSHGENRHIPATGSMSSGELAIISQSGDEAARPMGFDGALKSFASAVTSSTPPPALPKNPAIGWCSWYYYFHNMSEKVMLENIEAAQSLKDRIPIELIQIDDGYQPAVGDWLETTKKFPNGMAWLSRRIKDSGFKPGLWLAPFIATDRSELFKRNKEWFVRSPGGGPRWITFWPSPYSFGKVYGLDTTNPEAQRWLRKIFSTIVNRWGYEYLKLDFLYGGAIDGVRHDTKATRAQAFRRGLEAIREAAGDETFILGCGIPLGMGLGIVNGARISGDTAPYWHSVLQTKLIGQPSAPGVPNAARVMFSRYFMHRNFWLSDPDCLMSRFSNTALRGDEVLSHAACVALMGGPLIISDNLTTISSDSVRLAQQLIPPVDTPAVPADLFDSPIPATLVMPLRRDFDDLTIVGRFNWESHTCDLPLYFDRIGLDPEKKYHVYDLWEDFYYGIHTGKLTLPRVPAHASRMLSIRPALDVPHVVATTFHFTQGGVDMVSQKYSPEKRELEIRLSLPGKRKGRIYFCFPQGFRPLYAHVNGPNETVPSREDGNFHSLEFEMEGGAEIKVKFA